MTPGILADKKRIFEVEFVTADLFMLQLYHKTTWCYNRLDVERFYEKGKGKFNQCKGSI